MMQSNRLGDLNLTLLPTTGLRLSFIGDDGNTERLFTLSGKTQCAAVEVDEIPADSSGRSFNLKISDGRVFYFWCSEKSKLLGIELVAKMKDILKSKPSIADLSGISKSRLDCFATHLRKPQSKIKFLQRRLIQKLVIVKECIQGKVKAEAKSCPVPSSVLESPGRLSLPPFQLHASHVMSSPPLSPYYCWCPQGASTLQSSTPLEIPTSSAESSLLPPLPPLLSASRPSNLLSPIPPLSLADFPSLDFPVLLPDPLVRFPISSSQQIPTFTPLMCDPIVHIPVIDVCSSGQGYLVSAGPAIATSIPPLHPKLVNPLIPNTADSLLEKGARETLRLLMSSTSQTNPQFIDFLPSVLTNSDQKRMLATGSWSLYSGTRGVDAIANRIATMGLVSLSEYSIGDSVPEMSGSCDNTNNLPDNLPDESSAVDGPCSDDDCTFFSNAGEGTTN
ncbi:hypothetical protein OIU76_013318 [Salix suchowensis]|nr:hypothetical protein OIU76_013318 [Salix suchowensis]